MSRPLSQSRLLRKLYWIGRLLTSNQNMKDIRISASDPEFFGADLDPSDFGDADLDLAPDPLDRAWISDNLTFFKVKNTFKSDTYSKFEYLDIQH